MIDPLDTLMCSSFAAHAWLLDRLARRLAADGDRRQERAFDARDRAKDRTYLAADRMAEGAVPMFVNPLPPVPDPVGWFDAGLSALLLELLALHARPPDSVGPDDNTAYATLAESLRAERRFAFACAAEEGKDAILRRIEAFVLPIVAFFGEDALRKAFRDLDGRVPLRAVMRGAASALAEGDLPGDLWLYLEPQLKRRNVGAVARLAIKLKLWTA